ncbi:hypothetical protein NliqN6_1600 [Naganishia liquefaciens]|uniref:Meiotic nuclear division protein 1 n=1 Tax=Naganishia liquefaciens TaxID=104408 RepID=A0A8H3TQB7_9TREE|nr:hypothetical protein NliqN6_1600 [Naganishia liquefaciens]
MSKKGLSLEEKKKKMVEIFHETKEFYTLKELEKIAPIQQSVKDVLSDLQGDNLIQFDKIGTSNYFWSFPSAAGASRQAALVKEKSELTAVQAKVSDAEKSLREAERGREDTQKRRDLLARLAAARQTHKSLTTELEAHGAADPVKFAEKKRAVESAKEASLRWTDNTMILFKMATDTLGADATDLRQYLEIPEEWEDLVV